MKAKSWDPKTKARIILEGLRGRPVSEICVEYGVHNSQYYDWRDKFLKNVEKVFDNGQPTLREWKSQEELIKVLGGWIRFYNEEYLHSSLGYKSPTAFASPTSCESEWGGRDVSASYGLTNGEQYKMASLSSLDMAYGLTSGRGRHRKLELILQSKQTGAVALPFCHQHQHRHNMSRLEDITKTKAITLKNQWGKNNCLK